MRLLVDWLPSSSSTSVRYGHFLGFCEWMSRFIEMVKEQAAIVNWLCWVGCFKSHKQNNTLWSHYSMGRQQNSDKYFKNCLNITEGVMGKHLFLEFQQKLLIKKDQCVRFIAIHWQNQTKYGNVWKTAALSFIWMRTMRFMITQNWFLEMCGPTTSKFKCVYRCSEQLHLKLR